MKISEEKTVFKTNYAEKRNTRETNTKELESIFPKIFFEEKVYELKTESF